jgi:hypothetical protein
MVKLWQVINLVSLFRDRTTNKETGFFTDIEGLNEVFRKKTRFLATRA